MALTVLGPLGSDVVVPLPLFLSRVPAGFPSPADDYVEAVVDLNEVCGVDGVSTYLVRVDREGTSMVGANIGAGTITCNYDGYFKYKTVIGERAFIGSNSALIAPVSIGADAIVAAGSAVSRDVGDGDLRMVRGEQVVKPGWADRYHDAMKKKKAAAKK